MRRMAMVVGSLLMAAAVLWYFVGYKWAGGDRYGGAAAMFMAGLLFLLRNIGKDMER